MVKLKISPFFYTNSCPNLYIVPEYLLVALPSIVLVLALRTIMVHYNTQATEYIGNYVDHVQHYDHWDEWIHRTCSYTTCSGGK